jgi:hypothetical protein
MAKPGLFHAGPFRSTRDRRALAQEEQPRAGFRALMKKAMPGALGFTEGFDVHGFQLPGVSL